MESERLIMKKLSLILFTFLIADYASEGGWTVLFDGKEVKGLRGYKIVDGTIKTKPGMGIDLISSDVYKNFELELEWKVPKGGNSGIFYFATEESDYIWQSAPEMQVLDDATHTKGEATLTSAGSLYGLIAASNSVVKPVGEFNQVRIKVQNNHVEHWLNGVKVVDYIYQSERMKALIAKSKFKTIPRICLWRRN